MPTAGLQGLLPRRYRLAEVCAPSCSSALRGRAPAEGSRAPYAQPLACRGVQHWLHRVLLRRAILGGILGGSTVFRWVGGAIVFFSILLCDRGDCWPLVSQSAAARGHQRSARKSAARGATFTCRDNIAALDHNKHLAWQHKPGARAAVAKLMLSPHFGATLHFSCMGLCSGLGQTWLHVAEMLKPSALQRCIGHNWRTVAEQGCMACQPLNAAEAPTHQSCVNCARTGGLALTRH